MPGQCSDSSRVSPDNLLLDSLVDRFTGAFHLRRLDFGFAVINVIDGQIEFITVRLCLATEFRTKIGQDMQQWQAFGLGEWRYLVI